MDKQLIAGTYTYVKGNEGLDFWAQLGILNNIILSWHYKILFDLFLDSIINILISSTHRCSREGRESFCWFALDNEDWI